MKGIAVIAMIQVHIMELFAKAEIMEGPAGRFSLFLGGPFAAPVFMAVMGYFLASSSMKPVKKIWRGLLLILLGLGLNLGLNFHLLIKILTGTFELNPLEYIFGADILFLAGLSIIILALLEFAPKNLMINVFSLAVLIPLLAPFLPDMPASMKYLQAFLYGNYSWSYFPLFPWFSYVLLGYGLKRFKQENPGSWERLTRQSIIILVITGLLIVALFIPAYRIMTDLQAYYHHHIFLFTWIVCFLVIYTLAIGKLEIFTHDLRIFSYIRWLGKNVTIVYVIQWLVIGNIATAIYRTQPGLMLIIWFTAILASTSAVTQLILHLRKKTIIKY